MRKATKREKEAFRRLEQWWVYQSLSSLFAMFGYAVTFALAVATVKSEPIQWGDFPTVIVLILGGVVIGYFVRAMSDNDVR